MHSDTQAERVRELEAALEAVTRERDALWKVADVMWSVACDALNQAEKRPQQVFYDADAECPMVTVTMTELSWEELNEQNDLLKEALTRGEGSDGA